MHMTIFANGEVSPEDIYLQPDTRIIAADGGAKHCLEFGIKPDVIIGDFDSFDKNQIESRNNIDIPIIEYSSNKNETDLELALCYAIEEGATEITLFGLLGGRWDMSISNLMLLSVPKYDHIKFYIIHQKCEFYLLRGGMGLSFQGMPGDKVSVIPLTPQVTGITYSGLNWLLKNENLSFGSQRGMSNYMVNLKASIAVKSGVLLINIKRKEGTKTLSRQSEYSLIQGA